MDMERVDTLISAIISQATDGIDRTEFICNLASELDTGEPLTGMDKTKKFMSNDGKLKILVGKISYNKWMCKHYYQLIYHKHKTLYNYNQPDLLKVAETDIKIYNETH